MNFWIQNRYNELLDVIRRIDILIINEAELREISKEHSLVKGAKDYVTGANLYCC